MRSYISEETLAVEFTGNQQAVLQGVSFEIAGAAVAVAIERRP
jgi:hypothetical protein